jgi:hypothetical protein
MKKKDSLNTQEPYWSLGLILGFLGIPGIMIGNQLAKNYGVVLATLSIIGGNLILWIVGLGIVSMAEGKSHAIQNIKNQFGKTASFLAIVLFTLAFLMWYTLQLSSTSARTCQIFQIQEEWKIGLTLGIIVTLFSSKGFKMIKWVCIIGLPLLIGISVYYIGITTRPIQYSEASNFSLMIFFPTVMTCLAGVVNFPTFFKHIRSKDNATIALALIFLFHVFLQISSIFYNTDIFSMSAIDAKQNKMILELALATIFSLVSYVSINLINVYFISACWEMIFPKDYGVKKYVICSSIGTIAYLYLQTINTATFLSIMENAITYSMGILVFSLLIHSTISLVAKDRIHFFTRFTGISSWIIGCAAIIHSLWKAPEEADQAFIAGIIATSLFSITMAFIEEMIWSFKTVMKQKIS